jgi:hypothetical protein
MKSAELARMSEMTEEDEVLAEEEEDLTREEEEPVGYGDGYEQLIPDEDLTEEEEEECSRLQRNDPELSELAIYYINNTKLYQYGKALQENTVVENLTLIEDVELFAEESILSCNSELLEEIFEFIDQGQRLTRFTLMSTSNVQVNSRFLYGLVKNSSIKEVSLTHLTIDPDSLKSFLSYTQSVTKLEISMIHLTSFMPESHVFLHGRGTGQTAVQFPQNKSIQELKFFLTDAEESSIVLVLYQFGSQSNIKLLSLGGGKLSSAGSQLSALVKNLHASMSLNMYVPLSEGLQHFLTASATLESIEFDYLDFKASTFEPISVGLKHSQNLQKMILDSCRFDSESTELLQSIFQCPESKIQSLKISGAASFDPSLASFISELISSKPKTSKLAKIDIANLLPGVKQNLGMTTLLRPLKESTLKHLDIGVVSSHLEVQELFLNIPLIRGLKEITFDVERHFYAHEYKNLIIQAFKRNWSLEKVNCARFLDADQEDITKVQFYFARNKSIHEWILAYDAVPTSYLPKVFSSALAYEYHSDFLFRALIVMNDRLGQQRSLKRSPKEKGS